MPAVEGCPNTNEQPGGAAILRYEGDEIYSDICPNMKVAALRQRLLRIDSQFGSVRHDPTTPLYQRGRFDLTTKNLLLTQTNWRVFLSHFKWVLGSKPPSFFVRIVTDMTLKQVYMGEASFRARSPEQREDGGVPVFNSLEDLLVIPDLIVLRVGNVVYFNRAMASIMMEALLLRDGVGKPTWIVEPEGQHFRPWAKTDQGSALGMPCCNDAVYSFVGERFYALQLGGAPTVEEYEDGVSLSGAEEPDESEESDEPVSPGAPPAEPLEEAEDAAEEEAPEELGEPDAGNPEDSFIDLITKRKRRPSTQRRR